MVYLSNALRNAFNSPLLALQKRDYKSEAICVLGLGFAAYTYLCLLSFNPIDPSSFSASLSVRNAHNLGGSIGAQLSAALIFYLGIVAYMLPLPLLAIAFGYFSNSPVQVRMAQVFGCFGLVTAMLGISAKLVSHIRFGDVALPSAGSLGEMLQLVLNRQLGVGGSWLVLVLMFLTSLMITTQKSLITMFVTQLHPLLLKIRNNPILRVKESLATKNHAEPDERHQTPVILGPTIDEDISLGEGSAIDQIDTVDIDDDGEATDISPDRTNSDYISIPSSYVPPSATLFRISEQTSVVTLRQKKEFEQTAQVLSKTFQDFGISGEIIAIQPGPVVTVFEFQPDAGTKLAKINSLVDDIALSLRVDSIIMHPVRGKRAVGIQVPNQDREMVRLGDIIQSNEFVQASSPLTLALGKSLSGEPVCADLTKMPHLLTAGATGSGKSVAINTLLCSVIMKASPEEVRMILVDPKMLELSMYEGIPHLLMPVITEPGRAAIALKWATQEMERRYKLMQHAKVRNIVGYNEFCKVASRDQRQELLNLTGESQIVALPYILLVIDELADLMMTAPKEVEALIQRLAQKARASGIHLVLATQRPSVDIITGVIKANLPCRAAFQVVSKHDSRTILDQIGADKLLGNGDMLFQRPGSNRLERIQGAFISDEEVVRIVEATKAQGSNGDYDHNVMDWIDSEVARLTETSEQSDVGLAGDDPKYQDAIAIAQQHGAISASYLQRQLKIGYNRAARIVETMEAQGLVDKADGAKPRRWRG